MTDIVTLPVAFKRRRLTTPRDIWDSPQPSDLMTWEVCSYTRGMSSADCEGCPEWTPDEHYGRIKKGCRMWAEEACRTMMAVQRRETLPHPAAGDDGR